MSQAWREEVKKFIRGAARPADKFGHQPRVYALAVQVAEGLAFDDDVLFAAAWMHDLGVFIGHRPEDPVELAGWDHVPYTVAKSAELLAGWGFPAEKLAAVAEAIRTHQPHDDPRSREAVLLREADILEQLGAVGALRSIVKVGRDTRYASYTAVLPVLQKAAETLPGQLRLDSARRLAAPRQAALRAFLQAIEAEAGDLLD